MPAATGNHDPERLNVIKSVLRALLISNGKVDVTVPRLNGMYREEEGENIPFREFGFTSVQEFLRSIPDVVVLRYNREQQLCAHHVDTEQTAHVSSLVARQRKPPKKPSKFNANNRSRYPYGNSSFHYSRPGVQHNTMSTLTLLRQILDELRHAPKYFQGHNGIRKSDILQKFRERPNKSSINGLHSLNTKLKELQQDFVVDDDFVYFKVDVFNSNASASSASKQTPVHQNLQVRSAPAPVPRVETNQFDYNPVISQANPQASQVDRPSSTQFNQQQSRPIEQPLQNIPSQKSQAPDVGYACKPPEINYEDHVLDERIKFRLQKLIEKYSGIWAAELPSIYKQEYNLDLNYYELGFNSITEFVSTVPGILKITNPDNTGRHMLVNAKVSSTSTENKQQTKSLASHYNFDDYVKKDCEPVPNKLSSTVSKKFIPEGMMGLEETVENISVGSLANEEYFEVNISEIFTPSFFWITLRKNKSKIKKLMDELDGFYQQQDLDACRLPQALIEVGLNVACIYAKMWHRAIIKKLKPDGYVMVLFYDYGTVKTYSPNDLYYLHKRFSALPAQALACGLYNVKAPNGNEWPPLSINTFVNKVWSVPLVATVCEINEDNNTMMITLTDTNNESFDVHLNDWMIENELAVRGKMENVPSNRHHVSMHGVPLDKLCQYDEDVLRKRERDYDKSLKKKEQDKTQIEYARVEQVDVKDMDSASNYFTDSSFDASGIVTLVRENLDLTKQTNTITQAILSNMPINQLKIPSTVESYEISAAVQTSEKKIDHLKNSCSRDIMKISSDLNRNLVASNNKFSGIINDPSADLFKTGSVYLNQNRNLNGESSAASLSSLSSSYVQSGKHNSNEPLHRGASNQSLYSRQSRENNQNQSSSDNQEFDKFSFADGTPTLYKIGRGDNSQNKNQNEYPSTFVNSTTNQSEINNNATNNGNVMLEGSNRTKGSDEGYQTVKHVSSARTSNVSSSTSMNAQALPYTVIELSDRCLRKTIHVFHLDNEGWVPVDEFIDCFTNLKLAKIMFKMLQCFNISVDYKHLTRAQTPQLFSQLDQCEMKAPREANGKIKADFTLTLLPMKAMLHVLAKLDFLDGKIFKEAAALIKQHKEDAADVLFETFNNKILYDVLNLLVQYREFKRSLASAVN